MRVFLSLAVCTILILISISMVIYLLVMLLCKNYFTRKPKEITVVHEKREIPIFSLDDIDYTCQSPPTIIRTCAENPPDYWDLESARASPLPSYETVMYCDQLNRSFNSLLLGE